MSIDLTTQKVILLHVCEYFLLIQRRTLNICTNVKIGVEKNPKKSDR